MHGKFDDLGRFADPSLLILTSLAEGPKHGYAIMTDIAAFSGVSMEPGTLYGALARLERQGWITPMATEARRRPYEITPRGPSVLTQHLQSMRDIAPVGLARRAVGWYPRRWRERYAEEILDVLDQHRISARTVLDLAANAAAARLDPAYRPRRSPVRRRLRSGLTMLAAAATLLGLLVGAR